METPSLCPSTLCTKTLDFRPVTPWPVGLPGVALDGWIVAGFGRDLFLNYPWNRDDRGSFTELFSSVHPHLSFAELARMSQLVIDCPEIDLEMLTSYYGYKDKIQFSMVGEKLTQTPIEFQDWASRRRVSPTELSSLVALEVSDDVRAVTREIAKRDLTRQEGSRHLELCLELFLMGHIDGVLKSLSFDPWLDQLLTLRYPNSTRADQSAQDWVSDQSWPRQSQIRWVRQGDQSGLEVKMMIRNPSDFEKSKDSLERIQKIFEEAPGRLWPKH